MMKLLSTIADDLDLTPTMRAVAVATAVLLIALIAVLVAFN